MGEIKRQYRHGSERPQAEQPQRSAPTQWEVRQKANDFEVVQPGSDRAGTTRQDKR